MDFALIWLLQGVFVGSASATKATTKQNKQQNSMLSHGRIINHWIRASCLSTLNMVLSHRNGYLTRHRHRQSSLCRSPCAKRQAHHHHNTISTDSYELAAEGESNRFEWSVWPCVDWGIRIDNTAHSVRRSKSSFGNPVQKLFRDWWLLPPDGGTETFELKTTRCRLIEIVF